MKYVKLMILLLTAALLVVSGCERKVTEQVTKIVSPSSAQYLGSKACEACHQETYLSFRNTGHPFKLNDADSAQLPVSQYYPFTQIPRPPTGYSWSDVDKVIGGFWWKARFIDNDGYIITGTDVQYNFFDSSWTKYHPGDTLQYACGPCHMTAYKDQGNQNGKPGYKGTWVFDGIQCEECHGPGELHADDPHNVDMVIDYSSEACGKCHVRGAVNKIEASGDFIRHHEQWNEMFSTKHAALDCVDCHDPHVGLHKLNPERGSAIKLACENCHFESYLRPENTEIGPHKNNSNAPQECIDCHMPRATKSAVAAADYVGDVRTHLWGINTDSTAEMFYEGNDGKDYAYGYLTLEYTCLQGCHPGEGVDKDKQWAAEHAHDAHGEEHVSAVSNRGTTSR